MRNVLCGVNEDYMAQLKYIFYVVNIWIGQPYLFVFRKWYLYIEFFLP